MTPEPASKNQLRHLEGLQGKKERRESGHFLVEGPRFLGEALSAGLVPRLIAVEEAFLDHDDVRAGTAAGAEVVLLTAKEAGAVSARENAVGCLAAFESPPPWAGEDLESSGDNVLGPVLVVALCGLQDPGNVGTLIRSARAFGARAFLVTPGTADPFAPKVVRASAGAVFSMPIGKADVADIGRRAGSWGLIPLLATSQGQIKEEDSTWTGDFPERCLLILGHETKGVPDLPQMERITLQHQVEVDSLNVAMAGSIFMSRWFDRISR